MCSHCFYHDSLNKRMNELSLEEINALSNSEAEVVEEISTEDNVEEATENAERVEVNDSDANEGVKDQAEVIEENEEVEEAG